MIGNDGVSLAIGRFLVRDGLGQCSQICFSYNCEQQCPAGVERYQCDAF